MDIVRVLTIHQETATRQRIQRLLDQDKGFHLVGELSEPDDALPFIKKCQPQLVFLQASCADPSLISTLIRTNGSPPSLVVIVSPHDVDAVHAYEASAFDYLHEPFTDSRFAQVLSRARQRLREHQIIAYSDKLLHLLRHHLDDAPMAPARYGVIPREERLVVKSSNRLIFLDASEVDWIEAESVYVRLHVGDKTYLLRESLHNVEAQLNPRHFIRIHRSTMVNVSRIKEVIPHNNGGAIVNLRDGTRLKLSRSYRNRVQATLG